MCDAVFADALQELDKLKSGSNNDAHLQACEQSEEMKYHQIFTTYPAKQEVM